MVLSILIAVVAAPGLLGTQEAIRQSQSKEKREEHRARRCNLIASCVKSSLRSREINGRPIVLKDGKLWIDTGTSDGEPYGHPYAGYYLPYPDTKYEGLVTTITDVAPIMNWVYVDKDTYEVKYGVRLDAQPNLTGPFDCTRQDRRLTFDGWEGWCAVEEFPTLWALYYDVDDDGLRSKVSPGTRVLEVELTRKEKRFKKDTEGRQQDQTTKREVEATEDAPVDKPLTVDPKTQTPGVVGPIPGVATSEEGLRPFNLPKSIFNDPPLPPPDITAQIPIPKTPPPEYTPATRSTANTTPSRELVFTTGRTTPRTAATSPSSQPVQIPTEPLPINVSEKRTTPKLDRSRSSRALAQAQMFEAMAAGQNSYSNVTPQNGKSRLSGNTDSGSEYSADGTPRLSRDVLGVFEGRPDSSALPTSNNGRPLGDPSMQRASSPQRSNARATEASRQATPQEPVRAGGDPAVFGGRVSPERPGLSRSRTNATRGGFGLAESPNIRERPAPPKRSQTMPNRNGNKPAEEKRTIGARDPRPSRTVSPEQRRPGGGGRAPLGPSIRGNTFTEQQSRPSASRETPSNNTRTTASEQRRPNASRDNSNNISRSNPRPAQRNGSASSQSSFLNDDPAASRSSPRNMTRSGSAASRKSLAATMSSARGNTAMATRVGGDNLPPPPRNPANARTTSALLREIDNLVNMEAGGEGPPASLPPLANRERNRAPQPSRGGGRDDRRNRDDGRRPGGR